MSSEYSLSEVLERIYDTLPLRINRIKTRGLDRIHEGELG